MAIDLSWIQERVRLAQAGDVSAFGDVVEQLHRVIRAHVAMLGAPSGEEDELAQRAFVQAFEKLDTFDSERPFLPWLRGIARHEVLRYYSRRGVEGRHQDEIVRTYLAEAKAGEPDEESLDLRFEREHLTACLEHLTPKAMALIKDRYFTDLDAIAIAKRDGCATEAVRTALSRARALLRRCIESRLGLAEAGP
jgi:RNA polymerase sigma-70 factor, ECF subfamily